MGYLINKNNQRINLPSVISGRAVRNLFDNSRLSDGKTFYVQRSNGTTQLIRQEDNVEVGQNDMVESINSFYGGQSTIIKKEVLYGDLNRFL